jgi:type I restriction enzyme S subunit
VIDELPTGWTLARLGDLAVKIGSGSTPRGGGAVYASAGVPFIRSMNVHFDGFHPDGLVFLDASQARALENVIVRTGDVLLNITGASIGRATQAPQRVDGGRVSQHVCIIRPAEGLHAPYLSYLLAAPMFQDQITNENYGVTRQALTKSMIESFHIPLPPLPEQRRIVARIEALFARTRRARADLERIAPLARRFREALLTAAFNGELTSDWRAHSSHSSGNSQESPAGWTTQSIERLVGEGGLMSDGDWIESKDQDPNGSVRLIQLADVGDGRFTNRSSRFLTQEAAERLQCTFLRPGDVLIARMPDPLGRACIFPGVEQNAVTAVDVCIWRPGRDAAAPKWLMHVINSPPVRSELELLASGTTRQRVSGGNLKRFELPVPPVAEQTEIIRRLDKLFDACGQPPQDAKRALALLDRLEQSILTRAFRGELVPQDPNDKPASILLEQIKSRGEGEDEESTRKRRRKPNKSKENSMKDKPLPARDQLLKDSEKWPKTGLPFEAIAKRNFMPHDTLRDALFELLSGPSPALQQRFDREAEEMVIQRVAA